MRHRRTAVIVSFLALVCSTQAQQPRPISIELTGTVGTASDELGVFSEVDPGASVTISVLFDTSLPDATTITVTTGDTQVISRGIMPIIDPDRVRFFGILPDIEGLDADGGVALELALPADAQVGASTFAAADLSESSARVSYASLVSVTPLVIDESVFTIDLETIGSEVLDAPNAFCAPADFNLDGVVDAQDRVLLRDAFSAALNGGDETQGLDFDGDGLVTNADVAQAVIILTRCSNEGPGGEPRVDILDLTGDTLINILDLVLFIQYVNTDDPRGDIDNSGTVDVFDAFMFLNEFDNAVLL